MFLVYFNHTADKHVISFLLGTNVVPQKVSLHICDLGFLMELSSSFVISISPSWIYPRVWSGSLRKAGPHAHTDQVRHRQETSGVLAEPPAV